MLALNRVIAMTADSPGGRRLYALFDGAVILLYNTLLKTCQQCGRPDDCPASRFCRISVCRAMRC